MQASKFSSVVMRGVQAGVLCVGLLSVVGFFGGAAWFADLASHFRVQYVWALLAALVWLGVARRWRWVGVAVILLGVNLVVIAPLYRAELVGSPPTAHTDQTKLTVLLWNVFLYASPEERARAREYLANQSADVLALIEIDENWASDLKPVLQKYPYRRTYLKGYGLGLYSKLPFKSTRLHDFPAVRPAIEASIELGGRPRTLLLAHPSPPRSAECTRWRNEHLRQLASARAEFHKSLVFIGDLNATSWSRIFRSTLRDMDLRDSRPGFGVQATWPAILPAPLRVTLDHVLVSKDIAVLDRRVGPYLGSDHRPVTVTLGL